MYYNKKHEIIVTNRKDNYIYIGSYKTYETTLDNKNKQHKYIYIRVKCPYCDKEYDVLLNAFKNLNRNCANCCNKYENSFAYYIQQELKEPLNKYWDWDKNVVNPYLIHKAKGIKVWIKCDKKDYHGSYKVACNHFHNRERCPYCSHRKSKIHPKDSFGYLYPQKAKHWSKSNDKSPFAVAPCSGQKYKFYCEDCKEEFETSLDKFITSNRSMKCRNCTSSKGEQRIKELLIDKNVKFIQQKTFKYLIGVNNGLLSYDFYLPQYNLLIEYQGEQHEGYRKGFHRSEEDFEKQKEHDRRKKKYAKDNNIELLEIWYYDYENIEGILNKIF